MLAPLRSSLSTALRAPAARLAAFARPALTRGYQASPGKPAKPIKVYAPLPRKFTPPADATARLASGSNLVSAVEKSLIHKHDPAGWRAALVDRAQPEKCLRPGDIVRVVKADKTHFSGMVTAIKRNGLASSFLLRNKITGLGVEARYMVFSPTIRTVELVRRPVKPKRRAKLYYVRRSPKHDVGELETEAKKNKR